jgi:hypothetical protein
MFSADLLYNRPGNFLSLPGEIPFLGQASSSSCTVKQQNMYALGTVGQLPSQKPTILLAKSHADFLAAVAPK